MQAPKKPRRQRKVSRLRALTSSFFKKRKQKRNSHKQPFSHRVGNWFDENITGFIAPTWANSRIEARHKYTELAVRNEMYQDVLAGRFNPIASNDPHREDRWGDALLSPDAGADEDLESTQIRMRELYRTNTIAHSAIEGRVSHEVGEGIVPQSQVTEFEGKLSSEVAAASRRFIERYFRLWSESGVDPSREHSFYAIQRQVCREFANMGEAFVLVGSAANIRGPINLAIQLIAAERVETPPGQEGDKLCRFGVQKGKYFEWDQNTDRWEVVKSYGNSVVTGYWVRSEHPGDNLQTEYKHTFYPRFDSNGHPRMIHVFDPIFPEQSRGIPWLGAAANRMKDIDDYFEAELIIKHIESCFGIHIQTNPDTTADPHTLAGQASNGETDSRTGWLEEELSPGMIHRGPEDIKVIDPSRPGASFAPFIEAGLRSIASAANYPYELLAKNFFRTTFSSGKLAMLDGKRAFKMRQAILIDMFCRPLWKAAIWNMIELHDLIPSISLFDYREQPDLYEDAIWRSKPFGAIDEEKEFKARRVAIESEQSTRSRFAQEDGEDFFEEERIRAEEKKARLRTQIEVEALDRKLRAAAGLPMPEDNQNNSEDSESTDTDAKDRAEEKEMAGGDE